MAGIYAVSLRPGIFQIPVDGSTVVRSTTQTNHLMRNYTSTFSTTVSASVALLTALCVNAQEQAPAESATPAVQPPLLYVEVPKALSPDLDLALFESPATFNPEDDPEFARRMDSISNYNSAVEAIETEGGAWDPNLTEELSAMGILQQQQGDHLAAIESFNRAIHISRIKSGLYTLDQVPDVEKLIQSYLAVGNWAQADLYYDYLFYIEQRAYGPHDPRMIPVLDRLASWNIQAFNIGYGESLGIRLSSAQLLFNAAARMVSTHFGDDDKRYISYRRNIANSAYLVARNPDLLAETDRLDYRNAQTALRDRLDDTGPIGPRGFTAGELALQEIGQFYAKQEHMEYELASALADLADWYLMFERRSAAEDLYREAWNILATLENAEELQGKLLGQVIPIPTFADSVESLLKQPITLTDGKSLNYDYVDVVLDVIETGVARNVEVLNEETAANAAQFSRLRREIRSSYFRPRLENGELVRTEGIYFRYRYWY